MTADQRIQDCLQFLYGEAAGARVWQDLEVRLAAFSEEHPELAPAKPRLSERDAFLITYADQVCEPGRPTLATLAEFLGKHVADVLGGVHLLPHFPYSSDDGFSVIDYRQVNPGFGTWDDVRRLRRNFRLMFDGVINHISRESAWFRGFLQGEKPYMDYFITVDPQTDLSQVVRPRALPLLTAFETAAGRKHLWTTFSDDQIDLNFANPAVMLEIIDVLLFYAAHGAEVIRLDAIAYLWKEIGTSCLHLPRTHCAVKLFRAVLDAVAPGVMLITETNVPHPDNVSYFGDGRDEAQLVYNFALPPLTLHTFHTGNARALTNWAATLATPSPATTFFNFTASHDGIGLMPARGLLTPEEIDALVGLTKSHGGKVSYKNNADGSQSPYELNITLFDALNTTDGPVAIRRFLASQCIMLSLAGVPGIYFHSLFGSRNWQEGLAQTGRARTINRQKFQRDELEADLVNSSHTHRVFAGYRQLLRARRSHPAFHPQSRQEILDMSDNVFALRRGDNLLVVVNVTDQPFQVTAGLPNRRCRDILSRRKFRGPVELGPYEYVWLIPRD